MQYQRHLLATILLLTAPSFLCAAILNVPQDYATIQAGIDSARNGDTVLVQPGVYRENLTISKPLVLSSMILDEGGESAIYCTIIDGQQRGSVVTIDPRSAGVVTVDGFTIRNGRSDRGGGVYALNANTELRNLIVKNCRASDMGGGICYLGNQPDGPATLVMNNVVVRRNQCDTWAAVYIGQANATLVDVIIDRNASGRTGGLNFNNGSLSLRRVAITNNDASRVSGISFIPGDPVDMVWENVTISGNTGARIAVMAEITDSDLRCSNCLFYGNPAADIYLNAGNLAIAYSLIEGGRDAIVANRAEGNLDWGNGNIDLDPLFVAPDGGIFHLTANSPCIDAGDPHSPRDPDGTRADLGALFYHPNHPPVALHRLANLVLAEDSGERTIADLDTLFSDPDRDDLIFAVRGREELGLTIRDGHLLSLNPALNFFGDHLVVNLIAGDRQDSTSMESILEVTPVNDPPSPFSLLYPTDSSAVGYDQVTPFRWEASVDPDGNEEVRYCFYLVVTDNELLADTFQVQTDSLDLMTGYNGGCVPLFCNWWVEAISGADTTECSRRFLLEIDGSGSVADEKGTLCRFTLHSALTFPRFCGQGEKTISLFKGGPQNAKPKKEVRPRV